MIITINNNQSEQVFQVDTSKEEAQNVELQAEFQKFLEMEATKMDVYTDFYYRSSW